MKCGTCATRIAAATARTSPPGSSYYEDDHPRGKDSRRRGRAADARCTVRRSQPIAYRSPESCRRKARRELLQHPGREAYKRHRPETETDGERNAQSRDGRIFGADPRQALDRIGGSWRPAGRVAEAAIGETQASREQVRGRTGHIRTIQAGSDRVLRRPAAWASAVLSCRCRTGSSSTTSKSPEGARLSAATRADAASPIQIVGVNASGGLPNTEIPRRASCSCSRVEARSLP